MRALLIATFCTALLAATPISDWPLDEVRQSTGRLQITVVDEDGERNFNCTAFSVHEIKRLFMTADHCLTVDGTKSIKLDGEAIDIIEVDTRNEMGIVRGSTFIPYKKALPLGPKPTAGTEYMTSGYGRGAPFTLPFVGPYVAEMLAYDATGPYAHFSFNAIRGMSGGPIVDKKGRVVSLQIGAYDPADEMQHLSCGALYEPFAKLYKRYSR